MNKKISSVEWFADEIDKVLPYVNEKAALEFRRILIQAKEMHKEEIKSAYVEGLTTSIDNPFLPPNEYYKETFENE